MCFEWIEIAEWTPVECVVGMRNMVSFFHARTNVRHEDDVGGNYYWKDNTGLMLDFGEASYTATLEATPSTG